MAYKHIEIMGSYTVPGRGQIFITLDRSVRPGEVIEVHGKTWKVVGVELSDTQPHAGLIVTQFTESDAKRATNEDAKKFLMTLFAPQVEGTPEPVTDIPDAEIVLENPIAGMLSMPPPPKPANTQLKMSDDQRAKLLAVFQELTVHLSAVRDWVIRELSKFELGKDAPSVMVMAVSMPRTGMADYLQTLEPFLVKSMEVLEKDGKLPWANVKAVVGVKP